MKKASIFSQVFSKRIYKILFFIGVFLVNCLILNTAVAQEENQREIDLIDQTVTLPDKYKTVILTEPFHSLKSVTLMPLSVRKQMETMVDPGEPYDGGAVLSRTHLPQTQLVFGALSPKYCLVFYIKGGLDPQYLFQLFSIDGNQASLECSGLEMSRKSSKVSTLSDFKRALKNDGIQTLKPAH